MEGAVVLGFVVKRDGSVAPNSIYIKESSGFPILDIAAAAEATTWHFLPATAEGKPVEREHLFRVVFQLDWTSGEVRRAETPYGQPHMLPVRRVGDSEPPDPSVPLNMD
jgi:TonB family protein